MRGIKLLSSFEGGDNLLQALHEQASRHVCVRHGSLPAAVENIEKNKETGLEASRPEQPRHWETETTRSQAGCRCLIFRQSRALLQKRTISISVSN